VDETNQKVLLAAVKLYAYDTNALPGSLSQLRGDHLERAYALVTEGKRPYTFLAFLEEQLGLLDIAEAAPLPGRYLGDNPLRVLTCPVDRHKPEKFPNPAKHSYGITKGAVNKPLSWLLDPANDDEAIIVESDTDPAKKFALRHEGKRTFVKISAGGVTKRDKSHGGGGHDGDDDGGDDDDDDDDDDDP